MSTTEEKSSVIKKARIYVYIIWEYKPKHIKNAVIVLAYGFYSNCYHLYWEEYGGNCMSLGTVAYAEGICKLLLLN